MEVLEPQSEFFKKNVFCTNCGKKGHYYKNCYLPVTSLGIICIKLEDINVNYIIGKTKKLLDNNINEYELNKVKKILKNVDEEYLNENMKFLMIQRRNSLCILEFVRGKYKLENLEYILNTFYLMTKEEKHKIKILSFDELWKDIWNITDTDINNEDNYRNDYHISKEKYDKLKNGIIYNIGNIPVKINLEKILEMSDSKFIEPEWGFPKGRRNNKEKDINCAIREFYEETNFDNQDYQILNMEKLTEVYTSINNVKYKHIYYISQINTNAEPYVNKNNKNQVDEIGDIRWFSYNTAVSKLRSYNLEKINVLKNLNHQLILLLTEIKSLFNSYEKEDQKNYEQNLVIEI